MSFRSAVVVLLALAGAAQSAVVGRREEARAEKREPQFDGGRPERPGRPADPWATTSTYQPWTPITTPTYEPWTPPPVTTQQPVWTPQPQQPPYTPPSNNPGNGQPWDQPIQTLTPIVDRPGPMPTIPTNLPGMPPYPTSNPQQPGAPPYQPQQPQQPYPFNPQPQPQPQPYPYPVDQRPDPFNPNQPPSFNPNDPPRESAAPPLNIGNCRKYVVQKGDTCDMLAARFGMTLQQFKAQNSLGDPYDCVIYPNQSICV